MGRKLRMCGIQGHVRIKRVSLKSLIQYKWIKFYKIVKKISYNIGAKSEDINRTVNISVTKYTLPESETVSIQAVYCQDMVSWKLVVQKPEVPFFYISLTVLEFTLKRGVTVFYSVGRPFEIF